MIMDMLKGPIVMLQAVGQRRITLSFTVKHVMLVLMLAAMAMATVLLLRFYWQDMLKGFMMLQAVWQPPITITITTGKIILLLMLVATAKAIVDAAKKLFSLRVLTHTAEKKVCPSQVPVRRAGNGKKAPMGIIPGVLAAGQQRNQALPGRRMYPKVDKLLEECMTPCRPRGCA